MTLQFDQMHLEHALFKKKNITKQKQNNKKKPNQKEWKHHKIL